MAESMQARIDAMFRRDKLWAFGFVLVLWAVLAFVFFSVNPLIPDNTMRVVIAVAAVVLGLFNTASIVAMISHYSHDKNFIYELDIRHLDEARHH
ncbi:hypothetical protein ACFPL7_21105 [Dongia soli]|uniref:Uncharacterized protein n=1 Tax=Dongia soli TaxID=600628 RepID=A0ABU5E730_9PROT|nr:hypothetical protein [Dongia soli]MDY0882091.1 hypothetical protein [Dongia soli]